MASSLAVHSVGSAASFAAASAKGSAAGKASTATPVRAFSGLKQQNALCIPSKGFASQTVSNGSRVQAMQVWNPINNKKFETLSYLPPLSANQILRQVDYLLAKGWSPCIEFDTEGFIHREHHSGPGYYDGRYWTMWKLPLFGCQDANEVLREVEECKRTFPGTYVRVLGFNRRRQVQAAGFIVYKPGGDSSAQSSNGSWRSTPQTSNSSRPWEDVPSFFGGAAPEPPTPSYEAPAPSYQAPAPSYQAPQAQPQSSKRSWEDTPSFFG